MAGSERPGQPEPEIRVQLFPVSVVIALLFLLAIRRGLERGMYLAIALLPFGMAAFANLPAMGNLSLPAAEVVAGWTIGLMLLWRVRHAPRTLAGGLDAHGVLLLLLSLYAVFSGTVLVRLFERRLYVFPLNGTDEGLRVSPYFGSRIDLLEVGATNVSQLCYLLFSIAFFFLCRAVIARRTTEFAHRALVTAAWLNLALGALDLVGLDAGLAVVRTAKYALLTTHEVQGMARVIGGFPEASAYGGFSASLAAYFAAHALFDGGRRSALLAALCALAAVLSFSSTAYLGLGVAAAGLLAGAAWAFLRRAVPTRHLVFLHVAALGALALAFVVLVTGLPDVIVDVLDQLLFSKADSSSALERGAWATVAMRAFSESYYLGVGVGSLRGNGLVSVFLGSVGIPGTALLLVFYLRVLTRRLPAATDDPEAASRRAIGNAARLAIVTKLATSAVSATTPDPGLMMMLFCSMLVGAAPLAAVAARRTPAPVEPASPVPAGAELDVWEGPFIDLGLARGPARDALQPDILLPAWPVAPAVDAARTASSPVAGPTASPHVPPAARSAVSTA